MEGKKKESRFRSSLRNLIDSRHSWRRAFEPNISRCFYSGESPRELRQARSRTMTCMPVHSEWECGVEAGTLPRDTYCAPYRRVLLITTGRSGFRSVISVCASGVSGTVDCLASFHQTALQISGLSAGHSIRAPSCVENLSIHQPTARPSPAKPSPAKRQARGYLHRYAHRQENP